MRVYKILVVAPAWIGDMVMSQALLKLLKKQYADNCQIDLLVNSWAYDVVKRMPEVTNVHLNPFKHGELGLFKRIKLGRQLLKFKYDQAFILPNSFKSGLIPFFARIVKRTGFVGEMRYIFINDCYKLDKVSFPLMVERFCVLANHGHKVAQINNPSLTIDLDNQATALNNLGLNLTQKVICLCPGAEYGPAKRWPAGHFANLATQLQEQGYQVWIMGSHKEKTIAEEIITEAALKHHLYNLCGRTTLVEVIDLFAAAYAVVTNDSGLMHVAAAVNITLIAIYGSSSPDFTPPLSSKAIIKKIDMECSPCFARTCRFGHYQCLYEVLPEQILMQISQLNPEIS